jgi:hypothetical protein
VARDITAALATALNAQVCRPIFFFEGEFASETVHYWSGTYPISWNGQDWIGAGAVASWTPIQETGEIQALGFSVTVNSIPSEVVALGLSEVRQNKPGRMYIGALGDDNRLVIEPFLYQKARLDVAKLDRGARTATLTLTFEGRLIDLKRPRARRRTHQDQQILYPGDLGLQYVAGLKDTQIKWGRG